MAFDAADETSDDALMVLFANGDPQAAAILAYRHTPRVLALSVRLLGDQAEADDVAQDAMMRLWKIAPDWRQGEAKVSTWLYRVAHNLCTDRLRKRRGTHLEAIPEPEDERPAVRYSHDRIRSGEGPAQSSGRSAGPATRSDNSAPFTRVIEP